MVYTRDYHTPEDVDNEKYCVQRPGAFVEQWMDEIPTCRADRGTGGYVSTETENYNNDSAIEKAESGKEGRFMQLPRLNIVQTKMLVSKVAEAALPGSLIGESQDRQWILMAKMGVKEKEKKVTAEIWVRWADGNTFHHIADSESSEPAEGSLMEISEKLMKDAVMSPLILSNAAKALT